MNKFNLDRNSLEFIRTKKITFRGQTKEEKVYRIPINELYYNDLNGRIATFISQYKSQEDKDLESLSIDEYNDLIAEFIINSSTKERFKKTKEDIRISTQKEAGVVLTDGRIIDGNRRYTCLRELKKETGDERYGFFEAIILDAPLENDDRAWRDINSLELELQIGTDDKVDYSPIDWLVKVYLDLVKSKSYTVNEYSRITKYSTSDVKKMMIKAELMEDFLEFFDKAECFHIAKNLELDGPLTELVKVKRKYTEQSEWDEIKVAFYIYLWTERRGDRSRKIREMIKLLGTEKFNDILEQSKGEAKRIFSGNDSETNILEIKNDNGANNNQEIAINNNCSQIESHAKISEKTITSYNEYVNDILQDNNSNTAIKKPIECCKNALRYLNDIDKDIVNAWTDSDMKYEFGQLLNDLEKKVRDLKE